MSLSVRRVNNGPPRWKSRDEKRLAGRTCFHLPAPHLPRRLLCFGIL